MLIFTEHISIQVITNRIYTKVQFTFSACCNFSTAFLCCFTRACSTKKQEIISIKVIII